MILALDVHYRADGAHAAGIVFANWTDEAPVQVVRAFLPEVAPYEPGFFSRRELPCLLKVLEQVEPGSLSAIVVDGFVFLDRERKGLGALLYDAIGGRVPVIGVAKSFYEGGDRVALPLQRGNGKNPLWISAVGLSPEDALAQVRAMAGPYRLPMLLRLLDGITRAAAD